VNCEWITGFERFSGVTEVRQKVRFSDSRGTPATHTGLFDKIRNLFAASPEARETGLKKSHFSFLSPDGRCDHCGGTGKIRIPMDILADFELVCESCGGSRYKESVLSFRLFGKTIAEILDLSFSSAMNLFREVNPIRDILSLICRAGLGYLKLGQPLNSLSGGEAQRLTLVTELLSSRRRSVLYLFDEPTTGLHPADLPGLFSLFSHLLDEGHTLLVIEHNPEMILRAGWIIDLGPEAGGQGGNIVFSGQVSEIVNCPDSLTGRFLSRMIRG
jgi:excinuclease ABC subunit A